MSRSTTALKRLGVPGLAAVTMVAGLPLFLGTAAAAHISSLTLTPETTNEAAGVCVPYTAQLTFSSGQTPRVEVIDVVISEGGAGTTTQDLDFCTAPTNGVTPATPQDTADTGAAGTGDHAEFTTDSNGKVTFGIRSNTASTVAATIRAFYETTDNDQFDAGEFTDTSTATFTAGGEPGTNANQDAARDVEVVRAGEPASSTSTATITADNDTDTAVEGETRTYRVAVRGVNNERLAGVTVSYTVDSTVNSADRGPTTFAVTDNDGIATGTITFPERTGTGTDEVTFYVNQSNGQTAGRDPITTTGGEPADTLTVAIQDNAAQQNRTVSLVPLDDNESPQNTSGGTDATNGARDGDRTFRAIVDAADSVTSTEGTLLAFGVAGGSGDERVTPTECATVNRTETAAPNTNDSFCDVIVNDPTPTIGQVLTLTVTIRGSSSADTATLTFRNAPTDARSITLTPETVTVAPNRAQQLTATVRDVDGNPVQGVSVDFTEDGAGAFRNGSSSTSGVTNASGVATVEVISLPGETGTTRVTATISADADPATAGTQASQCGQAANQGVDPQGNNLNSTTNTGAAGVCSDTSTVTFGTAAPSQSASPSSGTTPPSPSPAPSGSGTPPIPCTVPASITLDRDTIIATGSAQITVRATPNSVVRVFAYSRPSTTYRVVRQIEVGGDGVASDRIVPPTNTRLYAQQEGCNASPSIVLNVRTLITLFVERNGKQLYTFSGRALPARRGGLIVSLYRVTNDGRQILTSQTRADTATGRYTIVRKFTGTGRFGFVVRTGQDLQNAPGSSNVRSLLVF